MKINPTILVIVLLTVIEMFWTNGIWGGVLLFISYGIYKSLPQIMEFIKEHSD
jgi:hypothetical protein